MLSRFLLGVSVSDAGCSAGFANGDAARAGTLLTGLATPGERVALSGDRAGLRRASWLTLGLLFAFATLTPLALAFLGVALVVLADGIPLEETGTSPFFVEVTSATTFARLLGVDINQVPTEGMSFHEFACESSFGISSDSSAKSCSNCSSAQQVAAPKAFASAATAIFASDAAGRLDL